MRIGLLSDTHVPYRAPEIPASVLRALSGVDLILHAGDVDEPWALEPLKAVAPVYAVRGNYHLLERSDAGASLPESVELEREGFCIALDHGHRIGSMSFFWKAVTLLRNLVGYWEFAAYDAAIARSLLARFPRAHVIVFGHTHRFYQAWWGETLLINPGAALPTAYFNAPFVPSIAHLVLEVGQPPEVQRVLLRP
ncbi:MAG: metallophosphoesterase family protein [Anaerolineales bacterium]